MNEIVFCNCESAEHFEGFEQFDPNAHGYHEAYAAEGCVAYFVGDICQDCADTHMKDYLVKEATEEEFSTAWYSITLDKGK
jgi:hypothetical protein